MSRIAQLNDALRTTLQGGKVMMTATLQAYGPDKVAKVLSAMRAFAAFTPNNDPHEEHDCAIFEVEGERFLFKIDYYDLALTNLSEDPADPEQTTRVLTVMHVSDY